MNYDGWVEHLLAADLPYTPITVKNGRLMDIRAHRGASR